MAHEFCNRYVFYFVHFKLLEPIVFAILVVTVLVQHVPEFQCKRRDDEHTQREFVV